MTLLPVLPRRQQQQADCLAVCAAMVLDYLRTPVAYDRLLRLLRVDAIGTPFRNLRHLESARLALQVHIASGDMTVLPVFCSGLADYCRCGHSRITLLVGGNRPRCPGCGAG